MKKIIFRDMLPTQTIYILEYVVSTENCMSSLKEVKERIQEIVNKNQGRMNSLISFSSLKHRH